MNIPHPSPPSKKNYRYPGVTPFTTDQSNIFFGRQQDTSDLYRLLRREPLVVLYGKSGLGKSSLLNAGIVPAFREEGGWAPLAIRFGAWTETQRETPLNSTKAALRATVSTSSLLDRLLPADDSLWRHAKQRQLDGGGQLLLIFDQFEELFSYPETQVTAFQQELAELMHSGLPLRFRRRLEAADGLALTDVEEDALENQTDARIVFAIRSDRLHLLDRLKDYLPNVLRHCFELKALTRRDAEAAIVEPARAAGDFATPTFEYEPAAVQTLLDFLQDEQDGRRIEGILLQMLCEYYERRQVEGLGATRLGLLQIGDPHAVVRNYYEEKIRALPPASQNAARRLIEDGLVSEGEAMRLSLHEAYIAREFGVDKPLLETLVDSRLLRAEPFLRGGYTYELSHDRLVPAVLGARVPRREAETREEALRLKAEAEKARQHIRTMRMLLTAALLALAVAVGGVWYAAQKSREAVKALNNYRQAQAAKERIAFDNLASRTRIILDAGGCPAGLFAEMQQIASAHVDSAGLNAQLRTLQQQNPDCR